MLIEVWPSMAAAREPHFQLSRGSTKNRLILQRQFLSGMERENKALRLRVEVMEREMRKLPSIRANSPDKEIGLD